MRETSGRFVVISPALQIFPFLGYIGRFRGYGRIALALTCWLCLSVLFTILCWHHGQVVPLGVSLSELQIRSNELGAFSFRRLHANGGCQPAYHISARNLCIDNACHGFFNTPLHKTVTFEGLNVQFHRYSDIGSPGREWTGTDSTLDSCLQLSACDRSATVTEAVGHAAMNSLTSGSAVGVKVRPIHCFWAPVNSRYFYTIDESERDKLINDYSDVWVYKRVACYAYPAGSQPGDASPVYRFWSGTLGRHFYTASDLERNKLIDFHSDVWVYEGIAWYGDQQTQLDPAHFLVAKDVPPEASEAVDRPTTAKDPEAMAAFLQDIRNLERQFRGQSAGMKIESPLFDIRRASKVIVRNLDYSLMQDGQLELGVTCRKAVMSGSASEVVLQGGVTVTVKEGGTLLSNRVVLDLERHHFRVPGGYILRRNGDIVKGRGLCCDHRLKVLQGNFSVGSGERSLHGRSILGKTRQFYAVGHQAE